MIHYLKIVLWERRQCIFITGAIRAISIRNMKPWVEFLSQYYQGQCRMFFTIVSLPAYNTQTYESVRPGGNKSYLISWIH
jgi:hypothetical protein